MTAVLVAAAAQPSPAFAQGQPVAATTASFNIPPQPLSQALVQFSRATGVQLFFSADLVRGMNSPGVQGSLSRTEALDRLLVGSGLIYQFTNSSTVTITRSGGGQVGGDGSVTLDPIVVSGPSSTLASGPGFQGTPDWVYQTPASVSVVSREAIQTAPARNARDLLDSVAGVWANRTEAQNPGISVNIRGLQDQNRVVTMIDGARQNFQRNAHGATQRTYVDTAFIRQIDIEKSGTSGVGGAGALGGSVNFRTIEAGDLIAPGKRFGSELNLTTGTNAYDFYGFASTGVRVTDRVSVVGGVSHKQIGEYEIGKKGLEDFYRPIVGNLKKPIFTGAETWSTLLKGEAEISDDMKLTLGWLRHQSKSSQGDLDPGSAGAGEDTEYVVNNTLTGAFNWKPANDLVDLKARLWYNHIKNNEMREKNLIHADTQVDYVFTTFGGSVENTSRVPLSIGNLAFNHGLEAFRDNGNTVARSADIASNSQLSAGFAGLNPSGRRDVASGFGNATLDHNNWLTLSGGLRYDWYHLSGETTWYDRVDTVEQVWIPCVTYGRDLGFPPAHPFYNRCFAPINGDTFEARPKTIFPAYAEQIDRSEGAWLPTAMVAVKPVEWLQPFVKYSHSFRPPTVMETFVSGGHPGSLGIEFAPNPKLRPERARTWEAGVNVSRDGVFMPDHKVRMKAVYFSRAVEDYIVVGTFVRPETSRIYNTYLNVDGTTLMKGVEVEGSYDAGLAYLGASFTYLDTEWAKSYVYNGTLQTPTTGKIINSVYVPPKTKLTIDAGVRLFDRKLTLGGRMTDVGVAEENFGLLGGYPTRSYTVYDLYGSYAITDEVKLRFAVNNLFDLAYVPALGEFAYPAPGRTVTGSLNLKF